MKNVRTERSIVPGVCLGAWLFLAVCRSVAAGDLDPVLVGQYPPYGEGRVEEIAISGDYAYVAFGGTGLQILDIRNPAEPRLLGVYDVPGCVMRVVVQGSYAYVRLDNVPGLQVLDVSTPTTPRLVASYRSNGAFYDLAVSGNYACLSVARQIKHIVELIDISNPQRPSLASVHDLPSERGAVAFAADGNIICAARSDRTLEVIDISDPAQPHVRGTCTLLANPNHGSVVVSGNYAYVGGVGLTIVDISNPAQPRPLGGIDDIASGGSRVAVSGALAVMGGVALTVIDVSDPENPRRAGQLPLKGWASAAVALSGHYAYVGNSAVGVQVVDVSSPDNPRPAGEYQYSIADARAVAASGNHAYVADYVGPGGLGVGRLQVLDVSNAAAPSYTGEYKPDLHITRLKATDDVVHLLGFRWNETNRHVSSWYETVDVSNPTNPQRVGAYDLGDVEGHDGLAISGTHAYVTMMWCEGTNWLGRLQVLDVSNPANPHPTGELSLPGVRDVAVSGHYACVLAGGMYDAPSGASSLGVIDISDPANPHRVGAYASTELLRGLAMSGQHAYVGEQWSRDSRLLVIDISNPTAPRDVGHCRLEGRGCRQVMVSGRYVCVAAEDDGLLVIDVSDPTLPRRVGRWATRGVIWDLAMSGRYVYAADGCGDCLVTLGHLPEGLVILDLENPACLQRQGNLELTRSESEMWRSAVGVGVSGPNTYVASCHPSTNLFHAIDTSDPTSPQLVGECDLHVGGWGATTIAISDQTAYVDDEGLWLNAVDLSDPDHPATVREIDLGRNGSGLAASGGYVYVAGVSGDHGLFEVNTMPASGGSGCFNSRGGAAASLWPDPKPMWPGITSR